MSEETNAVEVDPLSSTAAETNTDFPVLAADRILRFKVANAEKKRNEEKGNEYIQFKIELLSENAVFNDGKPARPGFKFNQVVAITPSGDYDYESIKRSCALWLKGCLSLEQAKTTTIRQFVDNPAMLNGLVFPGRTSIRKDKTGQYPPSTQVTPVLEA